MAQSQPSRWGFILMLLAAITGFAIALYAWLTPLTGVTGTIGALGVATANIVLAVLSLIIRTRSGRGARICWGVIILLVLIGTGFAALLLHQGVITAAMVVGLIGLLALLSNAKRHDKFSRA